MGGLGCKCSSGGTWRARVPGAEQCARLPAREVWPPSISGVPIHQVRALRNNSAQGALGAYTATFQEDVTWSRDRVHTLQGPGRGEGVKSISEQRMTCSTQVYPWAGLPAGVVRGTAQRSSCGSNMLDWVPESPYCCQRGSRHRGTKDSLERPSHPPSCFWYLHYTQ